MALTHKFAGSHIDVASTLPPSELLAICEQVATDTRGIGMRKGARMRIAVQGRSETQLKCVIAAGKRTYLRFDVSARPSGETTRLSSVITSYTTSQEKLLGLVPIAPKEMPGYFMYRQFMLDLKGAVGAKDRGARIDITERL